MPQSGWHPDDVAILIAGPRRGMTLHELADMLGRTVSAIDDEIRRQRTGGVDLSVRKPRWTEDRRKLLARRRQEGASLRTLEREFSVTRGTLTSQLRTLKALGYDIVPPPR